MCRWPLLIAMVCGIGAPPLSGGQDAPAGPLYPPPQSEATTPTGCFAVMGEVARPGAYEAPLGTSLTNLVRRAGGITHSCNGTIRIFRGGRFVEQIDLDFGAPYTLASGDLALACRDVSAGSRTVAATGASFRATHAVQIAFVNLVDHPVVVKMRAERATLTGIVEALGQATELTRKIRVLAPGGSLIQLPAVSARLLESGSVLVFPASSIRADALPPLPQPIRCELPASQRDQASILGTPKTASLASEGTSRQPSPIIDHRSELPRITVDSVSAAPPGEVGKTPAPPPPEVDGMSSVSGLLSARKAPNPRFQGFDVRARTFRTLDSLDDAWSEATHHGTWVIYSGRRHATHARTPWVSALLWTMSALAGLAICVTLASMVRRWFSARGQHSPHFDSAAAPTGLGFWVIVPPAPVPAAVVRLGRPIRIDAYQPMTRLSLDLGIVERTAASSNGGQRTAA